MAVYFRTDGASFGGSIVVVFLLVCFIFEVARRFFTLLILSAEDYIEGAFDVLAVRLDC